MPVRAGSDHTESRTRFDVLVKTCERLSYFGGGSNPSGTSSISQLAKTVFAPDVVAVCTAAIRAIDPIAPPVASLLHPSLPRRRR